MKLTEDEIGKIAKRTGLSEEEVANIVSSMPDAVFRLARVPLISRWACFRCAFSIFPFRKALWCAVCVISQRS